ncbi:LLM class flavin-dependent oxidoreductase [Brachybacterium sp. GU-2]|uniref:LLM class flavin-dependent oxidoreductase n=1 Tax=Brachybacterium sp. GU-2 TaxID=3069708 RepID=UPI00280AFC43|nr:LLM class flavin-dependent oxidoreductase [Brachybacterium sp. GU-2]WME22958.1 LLM class flavin-dependent oxidoreductase [Brachybacterium sp. GU-2]
MSTTVTPDETTRPGAAPGTDPSAGPAAEGAAGALPVLAVDLVTDPSLLEGLAPLARGLEDAGIGALTLSDGGLHPIHVAAHLAPLTRGIGLLPRADAIYVEPFHLATQLMSLDHISHGRAGWLLQAETDPSAAEAVGREVLGLEATAREAADVLEAARTIWGTWAPDAVVRDTERGVYVDASRLQYADVEAETFSVRGPAITPRSPQGLLPVLVADTDRAAAGERVKGELADGRVLDLDVSGGARVEELAAQIGSALAETGTEEASGAGEQADPSAASQQVRLVRLVGLDLEADPLGTVRQLADELRSRGLITPAPAASDAASSSTSASASGRTLRDLLGLPDAPFQLDPARRADRARLTSEEHA